jgi:hypothetical protein
MPGVLDGAAAGHEKAGPKWMQARAMKSITPIGARGKFDAKPPAMLSLAIFVGGSVRRVA